MSDSEAIGNFPSRAELRERIVAERGKRTVSERGKRTISERGKRTVSERGKRTIAEPRGGVSHPATEPDEFGRKNRPPKGRSRTQSHRA